MLVHARSHGLLLLTVVLWMTACTESNPDPATEEAAIREMNARWLHAMQTLNAEEEASLYAPDGVEYRAHGEPIIGPDALMANDRAFFEQNPLLDVSWSTDKIEVAASGDLAIQTGEFRASGICPEKNQGDWGRFITVWKKESGEWRIAHAMVSSTAPNHCADRSK